VGRVAVPTFHHEHTDVCFIIRKTHHNCSQEPTLGDPLCDYQVRGHVTLCSLPYQRLTQADVTFRMALDTYKCSAFVYGTSQIAQSTTGLRYSLDSHKLSADGGEVCTFGTASRPSQGLIQPPIQWASSALPPGVQCLGSED
jgi:hypothetical protein